MPFAAKHLVKVNVPITFRLETIGNFDFNYGNFSIYFFFQCLSDVSLAYIPKREKICSLWKKRLHFVIPTLVFLPLLVQ